MSKINLSGRVVLVTGGNGFLGQHVMKKLDERGAIAIPVSRKSHNLTSLEEAADILSTVRPSCVIHCAGHNGGIVYNRKYPQDIFYKNVLMALNIVEACRLFQVTKLVSVMTSCSYPDTGKEVLRETEFWDGRPNESIECHGLAKRVLDAASRLSNKQYGFPAYTTAITNLYGPGDTFNLERTKVVGALVRKFVTAKQENHSHVVCLGTGVARREFMYVEDAAEALVRTLEMYENPDLPLNIGCGYDVSIKELAETISKMVGYQGEIVWDTKAGDGQLKKLLDTTRMRSILGYHPETSLEVGLSKTIKWYMENQEEANQGK